MQFGVNTNPQDLFPQLNTCRMDCFTSVSDAVLPRLQDLRGMNSCTHL